MSCKSLLIQTILTVFCIVMAKTSPNKDQQTVKGNTFHPVVLASGYGGNQVYYSSSSDPNQDAQREWVLVKNMVYSSAFASRFRLMFDPATNKTFSSSYYFPGLEETWASAYLGKLFGMMPLGYFAGIVNRLQWYSYYKIGKTLMSVPYDFRKAPRENTAFFLNMKNSVEKMYKANGKTKVVLIGHSFGGLMTTVFLNKMEGSWKKKYIQSVMLLGAPLGGSVKLWRSILAGDDLTLGPIIKVKDMRRMLASYPASHFMLPKPNAFGNRTLIEIKDPKAKNGWKKFSSEDYLDFYDYMQFKYGKLMYLANLPTQKLLKRPDDVKIICAYGTMVPTVSKARFYRPPVINRHRYPQEGRMIIDSAAEGEFNDRGDGVVNQQSLELCSKWKGTSTLELPGVEHIGMLANTQLLAKVEEVLQGALA